MANLDNNGQPEIQRNFAAMVVCWLLGNGCLFSWNKISSCKGPHSSVSAVCALIVLSYNEAKINTWKRNLFGYILFFLSTLLVLVGPEQNALGNLLVVFLILGIFAGVTLDWLWLIGKGW